MLPIGGIAPTPLPGTAGATGGDRAGDTGPGSTGGRGGHGHAWGTGGMAMGHRKL